MQQIHTFIRSRASLVLLIAVILSACGGNSQPATDQSAAAPSAPTATLPREEQTAPAGPISPPPSAAPVATPVEPSNEPPVAPAPASAAPAATGEAFDPQRVTIGLESVGEGFDQPLFVTYAPDGSGRTFVVEKGGLIRLLADGATFLDLTDRVNASGSEQGLLGLAFHPRFGENGQFFVYYTAGNGDNTVSRFNVGANGAGDPASEAVLFAQDDPAGNHNGGMLAFGPDNYLYIGLGDGGGANDTYGNGQRPDTFLGKILRLDVDGGQPYAVPPDNPFVNTAGTSPEIWATGVRNPWRFSFDRATGELYIGDVGQNRFEWVQYQAAGDRGGINYGWPILEGAVCLNGSTCDRTGLAEPITNYSHQYGCSVTGGYVYRGAQFPVLQGVYIFGDYCSGRTWTLTRDAAGAWTQTEALETGLRISSFGEDAAGELYLTDLSGGGIYRITAQQR